MTEGFKLGRLPSAPEKLAKRLQLADYLTLPPLPLSVSHAAIGEPWGMLGNDAAADCTCAAVGHAEQVVSEYAAKRPSPVTTAEVLAAYSAITGYVPGDESTDNGANMLDVLSYWQHHGVGGVKCGPYVAFDPKNKAQWKAAVYLFGFAYIGVSLPDRIVNALPSIVSWSGTSGAPNPSNGHCVCVAGYNATYAHPVTWAKYISMSWAFAAKYADECYAVAVPQWAGGNPAGLNWTQLQADLAALRG